MASSRVSSRESSGFISTEHGTGYTPSLRNPCVGDGNRHEGNRMALANIRERLQLHFDAEATLSTSESDGIYEVHIVMPYLKGELTDE